MGRLYLNVVGMVFFTCLAASLPAQEDVGEQTKAAQVKARLQGRWRPESAILGGNPLPKEVTERIRLTIKDFDYHVRANEVDDKGRIEISVDVQPWQMTLVGTEGPNADTRLPAIFQFIGEKLMVCYNLDRQGAPQEFESEPNTAILLITFQRVEEE